MIYLSLGTNIGAKEENLALARQLIADRYKVSLKCSKVLETEAIGFEGNNFLNQIVSFDTPEGLTPEELLYSCKEIEMLMGRPQHEIIFNEEGERIYQNRIIDIDILFFDDITINTTELTIPHPQVETRWYIKELLNSATD